MTVTVYVPAGVPGFGGGAAAALGLPPPPHDRQPRVAAKTASAQANPSRELTSVLGCEPETTHLPRKIITETINPSRTSGNALATGIHPGAIGVQGERHHASDPAAVVVIVSFELAALDPGVTLAGENMHVVSEGKLDAVHARATALPNEPLCGVTETV